MEENKLQERIEELENRIQELEDENSELQHEINSLEDELEAYQDSWNENEASIDIFEQITGLTSEKLAKLSQGEVSDIREAIKKALN